MAANNRPNCRKCKWRYRHKIIRENYSGMDYYCQGTGKFQRLEHGSNTCQELYEFDPNFEKEY